MWLFSKWDYGTILKEEEKIGRIDLQRQKSTKQNNNGVTCYLNHIIKHLKFVFYKRNVSIPQNDAISLYLEKTDQITEQVKI